MKFDADDTVKLTDGTKAAVRYLNLVGDRYLEFLDGPGFHPAAAGGFADSRPSAQPRHSTSTSCWAA